MKKIDNVSVEKIKEVTFTIHLKKKVSFQPILMIVNDNSRNKEKAARIHCRCRR